MNRTQTPTARRTMQAALLPAHSAHGRRAQRRCCLAVAQLAVGCLYAELTLYPKPGLVSLVDSGSHHDMNAATFMRSVFALRHYFGAICRAGMEQAPFARLKQLGIEAERTMMLATRGVNTHRGAVFCIGLLAAAIGAAHARRIAPSAPALRALMLLNWGEALAAHSMAETRHAGSGAREEAALGLPSVFEVGLPALQTTLAAGRGMRAARIDALFALMAHIDDTNVFQRGGVAGAQVVRQQAQQFIDLGGTAQRDWQASAVACHRLFVARRLSPGGAADLLAATCLVHSAGSLAAP